MALLFDVLEIECTSWGTDGFGAAAMREDCAEAAFAEAPVDGAGSQFTQKWTWAAEEGGDLIKGTFEHFVQILSVSTWRSVRSQRAADTFISHTQPFSIYSPRLLETSITVDMLFSPRLFQVAAGKGRCESRTSSECKQAAGAEESCCRRAGRLSVSERR